MTKILHGTLLGALLGLLIGASGCGPKEEAVLEPIPAMRWQELPVTPFLGEAAWRNTQPNWGLVGDALRFEIRPPEALETRLLREDRDVWKDALVHLEQVQQERKKASVLANLQVAPAVACAAPSAAFSLQQRAQLQLMLQLHRNVLWRMGRLEMASRGVSAALKQFLDKFRGGRIKDADALVVQPLMRMVAQIDALRAGQRVPRGDWHPGNLQPRAARNAHAEAIFMQARSQFASWQTRIESSDRWHYLANTADAVIDALGVWADEFQTLVQAYRALAAHIQTLEREFAPPHALLAWPCVGQNLRRLRIISELYSHILPMQWALSQAMDETRKTQLRLKSEDYAAVKHEFLSSELERFQNQLETQKSKLSRTEDMLLHAWDETTAQFWAGLGDFVDPIHHHTHAVVENAQTWRHLYEELTAELAAIPRNAAPEPEQPLRRGKPVTPYITTVMETLYAPSRIDDGERGLLAISELEAHLVSIRDELLRLCKQGACQSFPEAEIEHSPRTSPWVVSWRQSPSQERTLGHTLIVIKLCQLHLARLVQRLTEIHAWFSETSNADLSWKKLKAWQRIWTLYAEANGTYANFLRSVAQLDQSITDMAQPQTQRAESETLHALLALQKRFFDLTLDYARMVDEQNAPPTSFDELITTWEELDSKLNAIERATVARDEALHPERMHEKRRTVDIPR